jgi:hypothetical protein
MHIRAAVGAGISRAISEPMERREMQALVARMPQPVAKLHKVFKAAILGREAFKELPDGEGLNLAWVAATGHRLSPCPEI